MSFPASLRLRACLSLLALLLGVASVRAQSDLPGFPFLRLAPSARAAALGGAFSAVYGDDVNALFYNPAALNAQMDGQLAVSYLNHLSDINAGFLGYGREVGTLGSFGAGVRYLTYGELTEADANGVQTGTFGASDLALTVGAARASGERLRYGASVHLIHSRIATEDAAAVAADVGVLYVQPAARLTLSASLHNLGTTVNGLGTEREALPTDLRVGVTKRLRYLPLLVSVTGYELHQAGTLAPEGASITRNVFYHLAFGGEFQFSPAFNLRLGYNHRQHEELKLNSRLDLAGVGFGVGLKVARVKVDYALNSWSDLGRLHQFTVRTKL
jgi:hypothetical protein